jgi:hypothetical protein
LLKLFLARRVGGGLRPGVEQSKNQVQGSVDIFFVSRAEHRAFKNSLLGCFGLSVIFLDYRGNQYSGEHGGRSSGEQQSEQRDIHSASHQRAGAQPCDLLQAEQAARQAYPAVFLLPSTRVATPVCSFHSRLAPQHMVGARTEIQA